MVVKSAEATKYRAAVQQAIREAGLGKPDWPTIEQIELCIAFHPKTNKDGSESKVRLDLDNVLKVTIDSLAGEDGLYLNDRQVFRLMAEFGEAKPEGGLTVWIRVLSEQMIRAGTGSVCPVTPESSGSDGLASPVGLESDV